MHSKNGTGRTSTPTGLIALFDEAALSGGIIPVQVLVEFMNVCKRKLAIAPLDAVAQVQDYLDVFDCPQTTATDVTEAAMLAEQMKLSYFDALILTVAQRNGATIFLSEDMHDGLEIDGLRIVNPFVAANEALLADYFEICCLKSRLGRFCLRVIG